MFESQLKLDLQSQYFKRASISEGSEIDLLCFSPYAFSKWLTW